MITCDKLLEQGLRIDGRRFDELRNIECRLGVFSQADGSAYLEQGNTKVLAAVYGPHECRSARRQWAVSTASSGSSSSSGGGGGEAVIKCQYSAAVFASSERRRPRGGGGGGDRRALEFSALLQHTLQGVICVHRYPRSQIDIYVQVLQADGGEYCACVNAAALALMDAGIELYDQLAACTAAQQPHSQLLSQQQLHQPPAPLVDLSYSEQAGGARLMVALLPASRRMPLVQLTERLHVDRLASLMQAADAGCRQVHAVLDASVRRHVVAAAAAMTAPGTTAAEVAKIATDASTTTMASVLGEAAS